MVWGLFVASQTVFTGDPDELIFSNIVKEVYWDGRYIVISGKNGIIKRLVDVIKSN